MKLQYQICLTVCESFHNPAPRAVASEEQEQERGWWEQGRDCEGKHKAGGAEVLDIIHSKNGKIVPTS